MAPPSYPGISTTAACSFEENPVELKLNRRLSQSADRLNAFELAIEQELRRRLQLTGQYGIVSGDGADVVGDTATCALRVNALDDTSFDVLAGTVVFLNGEYVDVTSTSINARPVDPTITDGLIVRLQYGEVLEGDPEMSPYYNFAAQPKQRKKTPFEMLVVETVTSYNSQPSSIRDLSVVLGALRYIDGALTVDNGRDTYSFARPWFTPADTQHRSQVGTGTRTNTNPHATSANDLTSGTYTIAQALVGGPAGIFARPVSVGRAPGTLCQETLAAGGFLTDVTGLITGAAGAFYSPLGFWPERLLSANRVSSGARVAAWVPPGRNVLAVFDPQNFPTAQDLSVTYTKVDAGALPVPLAGLTAFDVGDPSQDELLVAGGNFYSALTDKRVLFTDVGLIPMKFDVLVGSDGSAYKSPYCLYCNTKLNTLGASPQDFSIQPKAPSRLRVAIAGYNPGLTEVRFLLTGTDEAGAALSEIVSFTGPLPAPAPSVTEVSAQRKFTAAIFAAVDQIQVQVRNGDGANTTVTVFAEGSPARPGTQDDLLLASLQWTGAEVTDTYASEASVALDRRLVTRGGGPRGPSPAQSAINAPMLVESVLGYLPAGVTQWATVVEDFSDPRYVEYPNEFDDVLTSTRPYELPGTSLGARFNYASRLIPFAAAVPATGALFLRLLPRVAGPQRLTGLSVTLVLYRVGAMDTFTGTLGTNPNPPYQVLLSGPVPSGPYYGARVTLTGDHAEAIQGFLLHLRG
jgi:hypothetical protein